MRKNRLDRQAPTVHVVAVRLTTPELDALDSEVQRLAARAPGANVSRSSYLRGVVSKLARKAEPAPTGPAAAA